MVLGEIIHVFTSRVAMVIVKLLNHYFGYSWEHFPRIKYHQYFLNVLVTIAAPTTICIIHWFVPVQ